MTQKHKEKSRGLSLPAGSNAPKGEVIVYISHKNYWRQADENSPFIQHKLQGVKLKEGGGEGHLSSASHPPKTLLMMKRLHMLAQVVLYI